MAQPDRPNFPMPLRIVFGIVALLMIYLWLHFFGYLPAGI
jgi:hypothetical protein